MINIFRELSIAKKIGTVFLLLLIMMGIGGSVGLYNASQIAQVARLLYKDNFNRTETMSAIESEFLTQRQELFLHIVVNDEGTMGLLDGTIGVHATMIRELMKEYRSLGFDKDLEKDYNELNRNLSNYWSVQESVLKLSSAGDKDTAMGLVTGDGNRSFNRTVDALKKLLIEERGRAFEVFQKTEFLSRVIILVTLALVIGAIVMAGGLWFAITRSIVNPLLLLWESVKKMEKGDLKERAPIVTNDEIGTLATEFNRMAANMEKYYATLKKRHELEKETLARASEMKSQFLANVSHELRTPLNSIIGFSELLQEKSFGELNEKQAQYVQYINTSGSHLLQLINGILDLSKIEAGRMELVLEEFPLTEVIEEILATIRPQAQKKDITLKSKKVPASPTIKADRAKFRQILLNLLSNAVKFNEKGGSVIVDWDITEEPHGTAMKSALELSVTDTGCGIREEDIERLFGEFEQLDPTIVREHGGTGLGLALTKRLVELHDGTIWVESEHGKGCVFSIKLPQGDEKVKEPAVERPVLTPAEQGAQPLILVAGESEEINNLIEIYLATEGYDVITASDGTELFKKAREEKPFAIVMGVTIPKMDGWEALRELKATPETAEIPVVIISATDNKELGFALGAVDYMVKPVEKDRLIDTLGRLTFTAKGKRGPSSILVVDDDPQGLELLSDILKKEGFVVLKASDGEEAIKVAIRVDPDLIILDIMMPGATGFDVVDRLKEHPVARNIPIIIFTAKELSAGDKKRLGKNIKKIIQKAGFAKEDLVAEVRLLEMAYPERANMVDGITNLFNRRYFDIVLSREMSRSKRYGHAFSILLIDIDDFHKFNEVNGASAGDKALHEIARHLKDDLRKADCVTRYGGDSFTVLLPGIKKTGAIMVAEKLRAFVERHPFPAIDGSGNLTVSISLMCLPEDGFEGILDSLEDAVKGLYAEGGNRVSGIRRQGGAGN
jgi:diguanylate cyclase (GGDEF)-like protein